MVFMDCLIIGGVDGAALLPGLPDVPFVTLFQLLPTLSNFNLCIWDSISVLFSSIRTGITQGNWEKQEQQPAPSLVLGTCVRWDTAGLEELLVWED